MRSFRALTGDPKPSYDAVVIGAGIGGLVCANLLAKDGLRVLLTEQHYMVGGYCSTFKRGAFTFDAGTHFYPLLGNADTITGSLLEQLGVGTRWIKMDPVDHFHFPDGTSFSVPADFDEYYQKLRGAFPHETDSLDRFFAAARQAYLSGLLYYFRGRAHDRLRALSRLTLREVLDRHFRDDKLKLLLAADCAHWGSKPSRTSFVFDSMLRLSYFLGNYYPVGGSQVFADDLAHRFEACGGDILMRARVTAITIEEGAAGGVDIEAGVGRRRRRLHVRAGRVISNADQIQTLEQLVGPRYADQDLIRSLKALRPTMPCYLVHMGLRDQPLAELNRVAGYHWQSWDSERVATDMFKIFVPTSFEPGLAPPGAQIVVLQKVVEVDYDRVGDWAAQKQEVERDLMRRLDAVLPGIEARTVVRLTASARTAWRFTLNHQGAMLGWEMSPDQLGDRRPGIESGVRNLYFVGHWTRPGGGITPVIVSAMQVARAVCGSAAGAPGGDTHDPAIP
jgi:phytoene dehydrogenase-like protein